jgi:hypothetical protein
MRKGLFVLLLVGMVMVGFLVIVEAVQWKTIEDFQGFEDVSYEYNVSKNVTEVNGSLSIIIDTNHNVTWDDGAIKQLPFSSLNEFHNLFYWFHYDSATFIFSLNSSSDNQTGKFSIHFQAADSEDVKPSKPLHFIINATNDAPEFDFIPEQMQVVEGFEKNFTINATDEEEHYPLFFDYNVVNCSIRKNSFEFNETNCDIGHFLNIENPNVINNNFSSIFSFSGDSNRSYSGNYILNISVRDYGENYACPHDYCDNSTYKQNQTNYMLLELEILDGFEINASNCSAFANEGELYSCNITIYTNSSDFNQTEINFSTIASLNEAQEENYSILNVSWFHGGLVENSSDNILIIPIEFTPDKTNIGNWSIELIVNTAEGMINKTRGLFVNRTTNALPEIEDIPNQAFGVNEDNVGDYWFEVVVFDDDFLIPDKKQGYREVLNISFDISGDGSFSIPNKIVNLSDLNQENKLTNRSNITIYFEPNISHVGNYSVNVTVRDEEGFESSTLFNLSIFFSSPPNWSIDEIYINCTVPAFPENKTFCTYLKNGTNVTTEGFNLNLTDLSNGVIWADYNSSLIFERQGSWPLEDFILSNGNISFVPWKRSVSKYLTGGVWDFTIKASGAGLSSSSRWVINVSNINSPPSIQGLPSSIVTEAGNSTVIPFRVYDYDYLTLTSPERSNKNIFSLDVKNYSSSNILPSIIWGDLDSSDTYRPFNITFTPTNANSGNFTFNLSVTDSYGEMVWKVFNVTVLGKNQEPELINVKNISSAIDRNLLYTFCVKDEEDGSNCFGNTFNENTNFTFSISNLSGSNIFEESFNTSSGELNITFNSSHAGKYKFNLSVMDSGFDELPNKTSSETFWLFVYDVPNITFPLGGQEFQGLKENETFVFNFSANHSVGNNLNYLIYVDNVHSCPFQDNLGCNWVNLSLRKTFSGMGDGENFTWSFTPNFTDETYGLFKNMTIFIYPNDSNLDDAILINSSVDIKLNISHTNAIPTSSTIPQLPGITGSSSPISLDLSNYFEDIDNIDSFYQENLSFMFYRSGGQNLSNIYIGEYLNEGRLARPFLHNSSDWNVNLYSAGNVSEEMYIVATDSVGNFVQSNNFTVTFVEPTPVPEYIDRSSGGSTTTVTKHSSLLIGVPSAVQAGFGDRLEVPISIKNNGEVAVSGISLSGFVRLGDNSVGDVTMSLSKNSIQSLAIGASENLVANVNVDTRRAGRYLGIIYANVSTPKFNQDGQFYIEIEVIPSQNVEEILIFTEKLIVENPECIELRARLEDVRTLRDEGNFEEAIRLAQEIVDSCKKSISQRRKFNFLQDDVSKALIYLFSGLILVFIFVSVFYIYKRVKFNKEVGDEYV